jgi:hypothetical protein
LADVLAELTDRLTCFEMDSVPTTNDPALFISRKSLSVNGQGTPIAQEATAIYTFSLPEPVSIHKYSLKAFHTGGRNSCSCVNDSSITAKAAQDYFDEIETDKDDIIDFNELRAALVERG